MTNHSRRVAIFPISFGFHSSNLEGVDQRGLPSACSSLLSRPARDWIERAQSRLIRMRRCEAVSKTITDEIYHSQSNHSNLDRRRCSPSICERDRHFRSDPRIQQKKNNNNTTQPWTSGQALFIHQQNKPRTYICPVMKFLLI